MAQRRARGAARRSRRHRRDEQSGWARRRTAWGWGPTVRDEQSGWARRRTAWGWGPTVRDEQYMTNAPTILDNVREVAAAFAGERAARQQRRTLEPADFDRLR